MSSAKERAGSSNAKGKQLARDSDDSDEEVSSDGGVSISEGGITLANEDDSPEEIEAKWAALEEATAKLRQTSEDIKNLRRFLEGEELTEEAFARLSNALEKISMENDTEVSMSQAPASSSTVPVKASPSAKGAKDHPPAEVKIGRASLTKNERKRLSKLKPAIDQFLLAIGYEQLRANVPEIQFQWIGDHPHDADERVKWIQQQPKIEAFKTSDKGEALILECNEEKDGRWSPLTRFGQLILEDAVTRENVLPIFLWAHGIRTYSPGEITVLMMAKILNEGFDPYLTVPKAGRSIQWLAAMLASHRRKSPIWIVIDSLGLYDDAPPEFASEYQLLCQRLIDMTKSNPPDSKPVKLLLINPLKSKVVNKIKKSNPGVLILNCPTVDEFREEFSDGKMPPPE